MRSERRIARPPARQGYWSRRVQALRHRLVKLVRYNLSYKASSSGRNIVDIPWIIEQLYIAAKRQVIEALDPDLIVTAPASGNFHAIRKNSLSDPLFGRGGFPNYEKLRS